MKLKITMLGCGHSAGTPMIGNYWGNCDPDEPKNRRLRSSVLVQSEETNIVIDTGPDFRAQINWANIKHIHAVLYSHTHSDHISGIDELRVFRMKEKRKTDIYGNRESIEELKRRYDYLFETRHEGVYPSVLNDHIIEPEEFYKPYRIGDIDVIPYEQEHGTCKSMGYRFGDVAYSTDFVDLEQEALEALSGVKIWIADGCGYKMENNRVHASLNKLYALNEIIKAETVYVSHMSQIMDYRTLKKELPAGFDVAYDGLVVESSVE
jgi:phosphoribosyl 1,2-cyclic phosphate phosphodiesterase